MFQFYKVRLKAGYKPHPEKESYVSIPKRVHKRSDSFPYENCGVKFVVKKSAEVIIPKIRVHIEKN